MDFDDTDSEDEFPGLGVGKAGDLDGSVESSEQRTDSGRNQQQQQQQQRRVGAASAARKALRAATHDFDDSDESDDNNDANNFDDDDDDDDDEFDLPGVGDTLEVPAVSPAAKEAEPQPQIQKQEQPQPLQYGDDESSAEETGFRSSARRGPVASRRSFGAAAAAASEASDSSGSEEAGDERPVLVAPRPPAELCSAAPARLSEFQQVTPSLIFFSPLSPLPARVWPSAAHSSLDQIFLYRTPSRSLGKLLVCGQNERSPHVLRILWVTYNTLLPPTVDEAPVLSEGETFIDLSEPERSWFSLNVGVHGADPSENRMSQFWGTPAYVSPWGTAAPDIRFQEEGGAVMLCPSPGTSLHDYNPFNSSSALPELATIVVNGNTDLRWNPPHVLNMSESGLHQFQQAFLHLRSGSAEGLTEQQLGELLTKFFGAEVIHAMSRHMIPEEDEASDDELQRDFLRTLCLTTLKFVNSPRARRGIWTLLSKGTGLARFDHIIHLVDTVIVSCDTHVAAEFLLEVLFCGKEEVGLDDLKGLLEEVMKLPEVASCVRDRYVQLIFRGGKQKASRKEIRYMMRHVDEAYLASQMFVEMANNLSKMYDWEKDL